MARPPEAPKPPMHPMKKRLVALLALLALLAVVTVTATLVLDRDGSAPKIPDTATRLKLLAEKSNEPQESAEVALLEKKSILYSSNVYDIEVNESFSGPLPWASEVTPAPGGVNSFTWRLRLSTEATFSIKLSRPSGEPISIRLSDASGSPLYAISDGINIPAEEIRLDPGIYVLNAASRGASTASRSTSIATARRRTSPSSSKVFILR